MGARYDRIRDCIAADARRAFKDHQLTIRFEHGEFSEYRCRRPNTWFYGFDVSFAPGRLSLNGDLGSITLIADYDMRAWLRTSIDEPEYIAGKIRSAPDSGVYQYTEEAALDWLDDMAEHYPDKMTSARAKTLSLCAHSRYEFFDTLLNAPGSGWDDPPSLEPLSSQFWWWYHALAWFVRNVEPVPAILSRSRIPLASVA